MCPQDPQNDWLLAKTAELGCILPHGHAIRQYFYHIIQHQQWRQARLCPCPDVVWEVLPPAFKMCFCHTTGRINLPKCTKLDGNLFNLSCLEAKTKVCKMLIRDVLFAEENPQLQ